MQFYRINSHPNICKTSTMEKQSRFILIYFVFLIFAYVDTINCIPLNLTDPHICPRKVTTRSDSVRKTQLILECCPDYVFKNGKCQVCPAGIFGKHCLLACMPNYYGLQCKNVCNCKDFKKCNPVHGCVCDEGFTGKECSNTCPAGTYGVNCSEECVCGENAKCDPVTGDCICSAGWFGDQCTKACKTGTYGLNCEGECFCAHDAECNPVTGGCVCPEGSFGSHCTKACPTGKFGKNCNGTCACSNDEQCDVQTGKCIQCNPESNKEECNSHIDEEYNQKSGQNSKKSNDNVIVYITMVAALIGIVSVVTMVVKVKERLCRQLQQSLKDTSKPKLKRRMATRSLPLTQTQNAQTGSYIINTEGVMFQPEIEEDLYCEIGDINEVESDRY
ncbi:platelet endothelial aggregation receptor 1-like [Mytilus edulis]|uniref:platelet endothelial aggregation receptor 1-like n=1 Tax=Mytilus edulis TaxID=6550 RepID=UPI0039EF0E2E